MLAAASKEVEVSGESLDEMRLLEEQARKIAEEAKRDQPQKKAMAFCQVSQQCVNTSWFHGVHHMNYIYVQYIYRITCKL